MMRRMLLVLIIALGLIGGIAFAQMGGMMGDEGMMSGETGEQETQPQQIPYQMGPGMMAGMPGMMMGPCMTYGMMGGMGPMMGGMPGMMGMMGPGMMGMMHRMMGGGMGYGMMGGYGMGPGMMMGPGMPYGMMGGYGMGPGMMGYGYSKDYQKFLDETRDLRKQLNEKRFEYFEALRNPETKPETVEKLAKEIYELKKKIYEKSPYRGLGPCGCH